MKKMKKILSGLLVAAMLMSPVSVFASDEAMAADGYPVPQVVADDTFKLGYLHSSLDTESRIRTFRQVEIEAAHRGWELVAVPITDEQSQRDGLQNLINQEVDAIMIGSMTMTVMQDLIIKAREAGIGVYCNDSQLVEGCIMNSTMPNAVAASELFYKAGNELKWEGNVCVITARTLQVHIERTDSISALCGVGHAYPGLTVLDEQDINVAQGGYLQQTYDITSTWLKKYGEDIDLIVASWDEAAMGAAEAIKASGMDIDTFAVSVDGGSQTWAYIREGTAFKYDYAQPFELYTHKVCDVIDQVQIQGIQPGEEGSLLEGYGDVLYATGIVVGPNNVPDVGESIHAVFDYYGGSADDADAWYNWTDADGAYIITDGSEA